MRVLVEKECGDASLLQDADREHAGDAERVVGAGDDPTMPDLSLLDAAIRSGQHNDPRPLHKALATFFETFNAVVNTNPTNRIEVSDLVRLKELTARLQAGALSTADAELQGLLVLAKRHGKAVGAVYKFFLYFDPYGMFAQIRRAGLKAFQPLLGPLVVVDGVAVRDVLSRHDEFTVAPYGVEMAKIMTAGRNGAGGEDGLENFILGTDDTLAFESDKRLLTQVVNRHDPHRIRPLIAADCRRRVGLAVQTARDAGRLRLDVVQAVARFVPVTMGKVYLGVPCADGIEHFELSDDMQEYYGADLLGGPDGQQRLDGTGLRADAGIVADEATMYHWIKTAFQCFFNNVSKDMAVQREGFRSCRLLLCSLLREIQQQRQRLGEGARLAALGRPPGRNQVRNTMLTRLVRLQVQGGFPAGQVTDLRIAENVMGTTVGAVAGQEEATCRVIDALLKLQEGRYSPSRAKRMRGSFDDAREQALIAVSPSSGWRSKQSARTKLLHYFRECLRMEPQGEVLLRQCQSDGAQLFATAQQPDDPALAVFAGNRPIRAGELIFAAHGSAMKDVYAADEFRLRRRPSDETYLFYGYGRHKCLGQHISPVIIVESMIAVLALEGLQRAGDFQLDDKRLYARELKVSFDDTGSTRAIYPGSNAPQVIK